MIDTHCHLYAKQFDEDREEVLDRAAEAGISHIFLPAINLQSIPKMDSLSHAKITFYKMAGIHPTEFNDRDAGISEDELLEYCRRDDIVGVGETGLDYYWSDEHKSAQQKSLQLHCRVAKEVQKPIVLHNRDSTEDLLSIIEEEQDGSLKGVWHSFTGSAAEGARAIDLGLEIGIGGIFTFKNAGVDKAVAELPLEHIMLETDAPYLAPSPKRGKRNEPAFVKYTAKRLAEVKEVPLDEVITVTDGNSLQLFGV